MRDQLRMRIVVEAVMAGVLLVATLLTALAPTWIETVLRIDPDAGSGALEWMLVAALAVATITSARLARRDLRTRRALLATV
jgi:hypothetical protein